MLYAEQHPVLGLVLLAPSPPAGALPRRPSDHELKDVPPVYDARWWGWITDWDKLHEVMPDMTDAALEKMQEMMDGARVGQRPAWSGCAAWRSTPRGSRCRRWSSQPGAMTSSIPPRRRTADLLGAAYEYFPSASHFGLVMGEETWPQVAGSVLGWLEERRHAMTAQLTAVGAGRALRLQRAQRSRMKFRSKSCCRSAPGCGRAPRRR